MFSNYIKDFAKIKVLVVGDAMLDRYYHGVAERICREAPVPIIDITAMHYMPGGAANAAVNLATLGAETHFLSVIGDDTEGTLLSQGLKKYHVHISDLTTDSKYSTMTKTRVQAKEQLLLRFDTGNQKDNMHHSEDILLKKLLYLYPASDAILISDYGYGVLTDTIRHILKTLQEKYKKIVFIDAKYPEKYANFPAFVIKPNYEETLALLGIGKVFGDESRVEQILSYREDLCRKLQSKIITVTLDTDGSLILKKNGTFYQTHTSPQENSKAAGAGDTYISALLLATCAGASIQHAGEIAATAASITVQKSATAYCTQQELLHAFSTNSKYITSNNRMKEILHMYKKQNKKIVFTNGCFDILHSGHITYLSRAKSLGDILIVGLNTDESIKRNKGFTRPINTLADRIKVLSGLSSVDCIIPFKEDTPLNLIEKIHPDVYVKGGDYTKEMLSQEAAIVEKNGGIVHILPFVKGKSTTNIIQKIHTSLGGRHVTS